MQYTATLYILITTETTEQQGNFNLFQFQYDQMWLVNITGKTRGWLVNSRISPDIVCWLTVILSPAQEWYWLPHGMSSDKVFSFFPLKAAILNAIWTNNTQSLKGQVLIFLFFFQCDFNL